MKKIIYSIIFLIGLFYSCSEDNFTKIPKGQASEGLLASKAGIDKLLIGAYAASDGEVANNATMSWASTISHWVFGSVTSDDARKGSSMGDQGNINPIEYFYVNADNAYVNDYWRAWFDAVVRANDVLRLLPKATDMTDAQKEQATAEARFLRGNAYFNLTIVFGKVPYIDETTVDPGLVANDHAVWAEIEADFTAAAAALPHRQAQKGRATKWAAKTYLARTLMFEKKFAEAKPILQDILDNGGFALMPSYEQNYLIAYNNNAESIWEIEYAVNDGFNGSPNASFGNGLAKPLGTSQVAGAGNFFSATHDFVAAFRVGDDGLPDLSKADNFKITDTVTVSRHSLNSEIDRTQAIDVRIDHTVSRPGIPYLDWGIIKEGTDISLIIWNLKDMGPYANIKKTVFKKSEQAMATTTGWMTGINPNNLRVYRLANVILWLAECEVEVGSLQKATDLVNMIRNRTKNSNKVLLADGITPAANYKCEPYPVAFADQTIGRKAVRLEQRLEFGMEGFRFFDLVRWGIAADVLNNYMKEEAKLCPPLSDRKFTAGQNEVWPIPLNQINLTNKDGKTILTQNPGY